MIDREKDIICEIREVIEWNDSYERSFKLNNLYARASKMGIEVKEVIYKPFNQGLAKLRRNAGITNGYQAITQ